MASVLLNYVYYNPVGHIVEALKVAKGYHAANPDLEIEVLLNQHAPEAERRPPASDGKRVGSWRADTVTNAVDMSYDA